MRQIAVWPKTKTKKAVKMRIMNYGLRIRKQCKNKRKKENDAK